MQFDEVIKPSSIAKLTREEKKRYLKWYDRFYYDSVVRKVPMIMPDKDDYHDIDDYFGIDYWKIMESLK